MSRCTACGLPLSPTRTYTQCPRCGAALGNTPGAAPAVSYGQQRGSGIQIGLGIDPAAQTQQSKVWGAATQTASSSPWNQAAPSPSMLPQTPPPQQPLWLSGQQVAQPGSMNSWAQTPSRPFTAQPTRQASRARLGFIVSGMCIFTAALLLFFVWFMSMNAVNNPNNSNASTNVNSIATTTQPTASPTAAASPTGAASPTATSMPGEQYIDNAQLASSIDQATGQPLKPTTSFKVNQNIYVTFSLHPQGQAGAVCIIWYLNNQQATHFEFAVRPTSKSGYSYAILGQPGSAYVNLYWASSTACADKTLAQHVPFTVTAS